MPVKVRPFGATVSSAKRSHLLVAGEPSGSGWQDRGEGGGGAQLGQRAVREGLDVAGHDEVGVELTAQALEGDENLEQERHVVRREDVDVAQERGDVAEQRDVEVPQRNAAVALDERGAVLAEDALVGGGQRDATTRDQGCEASGLRDCAPDPMRPDCGHWARLTVPSPH